MLLWGCVLGMQGHDVFCNIQACLVYLELILIAQYIFQIPTHLHCKAVSDTTQVCDSFVRACMCPCMHVSVRVCVHVSVHECVRACMCLCMCACMCLCMFACMCPCMHVSVGACVCRPCPLSCNSLFDQQLHDAATLATQALHAST